MSKVFKIDKSVFTAEERAQYEALIAKATVDPEAAQDEMEKEIPPATPPKKKTTEKAEVDEMEDTKKSAAAAEVPDFVKAAIAKSEEFITKAEKQEQLDIAKKYAPLVESVEDLADQLYGLKKSDPKMYETCISMMDNQLNLIEKSSLFGEVGKSAGSYANNGFVDKAEAKAQEIMKSNPHMDYDTAIAKAYEDPSIMAECDAAYYGR